MSKSGNADSIADKRTVKKTRLFAPNPKGIINRDITPSARPK